MNDFGRFYKFTKKCKFKSITVKLEILDVFFKFQFLQKKVNNDPLLKSQNNNFKENSISKNIAINNYN